MEYIKAKQIVTKNRDSSWFGMDYNMNIYRGCCHGCIYCDSRSSCYRIEDFDKVKAKENALAIIRDDLRRKTRTGVVGTGSMSDPYNPLEKECRLTRNAMELIDAFGFGTGVATKSPMVTRDIDILKTIKEHSPVLVKITITAADDELSKRIEPYAPVSSERFEAIRKLSSAGIFCGIFLMPVLPFLTDTQNNILEIVNRGAEAGAKFIYPAFGVTLRENQREYFFDHLDQEYPGMKEKYIKRFGNRYQCSSPYAKKLYHSMAAACVEKKIFYTMSDIILAYKRGYEYEQMTLF